MRRGRHEAIEIEMQLPVECGVAVAVSLGIMKREVVIVHHAASFRSVPVSGQKPKKVVFLPVCSFFFGGGGPNGKIGDVIDDSSEGLPVSVVEHDLVDCRETSLITVFDHLVRLSVN